jgi:hypothetical protein
VKKEPRSSRKKGEIMLRKRAEVRVRVRVRAAAIRMNGSERSNNGEALEKDRDESSRVIDNLVGAENV